MGRSEMEALAQLLAPRVAALVLTRLATALSASDAPYSTRKGFEPPEFQGRPKAWKRIAPTIDGHTKIGRWITVPRSSYAKWLDSQSATTTPTSTTTSPANDATPGWTPAMTAAAMGYRRAT